MWYSTSVFWQWDFTGWGHDNAIFERVIKALRTDGGKEIPPTPKL